MRIRILVIIGCVGLLVSCAAQKHKLLPDARSQYEYALSTYQKGHYDDAILEFQKVLFNYPGLSFIDSAQYWFAMSYYMREDYHLGISEFRRLTTQFPNSELADDAQFMIGKSSLEAAPGNPGLDQADTRQAIKELEAFIEDYPFSDRIEDGKKLLQEAEEKIVEKQFNSARQYYRMGNNGSSRLYFEDIVTEHANSSYVPAALYMLAKIDEREKKFDDARDKLTNLLSKFPDAEISEDARKLKDEISRKAAEQQEEQGAQADNRDRKE